MRLRPHREMEQDPGFPYQVGRLVGAAEMAAVAMRNGKLSADELSDFGARLELVTAWFFEPKTMIELPQPTPPPVD